MYFDIKVTTEQYYKEVGILKSVNIFSLLFEQVSSIFVYMFIGRWMFICTSILLFYFISFV